MALRWRPRVMTDVTVAAITDDTNKTMAALYAALSDIALELFRQRTGTTAPNRRGDR
ncbi:MAG: hypothetical protein A07HR60_01256 [uncultured archaeon A07HR60]|nr:MAG: hypothetical protein A07HR60_01256 [uncultured archaeon A07HR60]